MDLRTLAALAALLLLTTSGCGDDTAATTDDSNETERAAPAGLAAAVLPHPGDHRTSDLHGGLTDMEDQRYVLVSMVLDGGDNSLEIRASDPAYLPGDRGPDECEGGEDVQSQGGATHQCRVLDDGTVVDAYLVPARKQTGGRSLGLAYVEGPDRSVQVHFQSAAHTPELTWDELVAIAEDPLVAWDTSAALNDAGGDVNIQVDDRVDR